MKQLKKLTAKQIIILVVILQAIAITILYNSVTVVNMTSFISAVITFECFLVFLFFLTIKQFIEALKPKDVLTNLRYLIFGVLLLTDLILIPSIVYQFYRSVGQDSEIFRNFVTYTSRINLIGFTVLFVLIFTYRIKKK